MCVCVCVCVWRLRGLRENGRRPQFHFSLARRFSLIFFHALWSLLVAAAAAAAAVVVVADVVDVVEVVV